ncbi:MAG: type II toxin-antitoxin system PemK/MazF family toxin [Prevotellaceae bacterium]|jgi:mRNA interferase MazF|nr:type II toxin-antitoxin system PemK/MazF family toxin [Prevotellaceae bacterium]
MERFVKADVVVVSFPFSDLSASKRRPALVLADLPGNDILLCQITSLVSNEQSALPLVATDFIMGSLPVNSYIRPARIFTADKQIIIRKAGKISSNLMNEVIDNLISILKQ